MTNKYWLSRIHLKFITASQHILHPSWLFSTQPTTYTSQISHLHLNPFQNLIYYYLLNLKPYFKPNNHHSILYSLSPSRNCNAPQPKSTHFKSIQQNQKITHPHKHVNPIPPILYILNTTQSHYKKQLAKTQPNPIPIKHNWCKFQVKHILAKKQLAYKKWTLEWKLTQTKSEHLKWNFINFIWTSDIKT